MPLAALIAIGAGLASAAAAMAFLSGMVAAFGLVYLAPLPMLMAGLALGPRATAFAALAGIMAMGMFGGMPLAVLFAVIHGLPSWIIAKLALMASGAQTNAHQDVGNNGVPGTIQWISPGQIVSAMTCFAAGLVVISSFAVGDVGMSGFVAEHLGQIFERVAPGMNATDRGLMTQTMTPLFPGTVATSWVVMVAVNAVLAQGLLVRIGRNRRPSPSYVGLELPGWMSWPLVGAAILALVGSGEWEYLGRNLAMVLALPYFFLGLAVFHTLARRVTATMPLLVAFYLVIVISVWAALVVAGIGVAEQWYGLRRRVSARSLSQSGDDEKD